MTFEEAKGKMMKRLQALAHDAKKPRCGDREHGDIECAKLFDDDEVMSAEEFFA